MGPAVVVENRPGGDGFVAITAFLSAHDDHMLFFGPAASFTAHPYLHDKLPYDPRDLAPVARVSATLISLTAPPQLDVNSLGDLFAMARAQPGKLNWASVTGATDLVIAAFLKREGSTWRKCRTAIRSRRSTTWPRAVCIFTGRRSRSCGARSRRAASSSWRSRRAEPSPVVPGVPTVYAGRVSRAHLRRPGRFLWHARHADRLARADRNRRSRSACRSGIVERLAGHRTGGGSGFGRRVRSRHRQAARGAAENAKVLGIKAAQ